MSVPALRFPEFTDKWRPIKAGDAFINSRTKGEYGLPIYSVTLYRGMVRRDSLDRQMMADAADGANLRAQPGDLVYNMMRMWQGAVGLAPEECMVSPAYVVLSPKSQTCSKFFDYWFKSPKMIYKLWAYSHGLTSDRLRLYYNDFSQIPTYLPSLLEQQKVAKFLETIDSRLDGVRRKRELLTQYKAGITQKLFSQQLRFVDKTGVPFPAWKSVKLGDVFNWVKTNSLSREYLTCDEGGIQNIHYGDIHSKFKGNFRQSSELVPFIKKDAPVKDFSDEEYCRIGDVIIADASEDLADIGKAIEILEVKERSMVAGLHTFIARPKPDLTVLGFSGYLLRSPGLRRQITHIAQGVSVLGISKKNLSNLDLFLPHPEEQVKISGFLSAIDSKIDAVTVQAEKLEAFKNGLIEQMYI